MNKRNVLLNLIIRVCMLALSIVASATTGFWLWGLILAVNIVSAIGWIYTLILLHKGEQTNENN